MAEDRGGSGVGNPVFDFVVDAVRDVLGPQPRRPTPQDEAILRDAGWQYGTNRSGGFVPGLILPGRGAALAVWQSPSGQQYSRDAARRQAEQIRANPPAGGGGTPGINPNAPPPQFSAWDYGRYVPGSIFQGSKGPRKRRRVKRRTPQQQLADCETDTECEAACALPENQLTCYLNERRYERDLDEYYDKQPKQDWNYQRDAVDRPTTAKAPTPTLPDLWIPTTGSRGTGTLAKRVRWGARIVGRYAPWFWVLYPSKLPKWDVIEPWEYDRPDIMVEPKPQPIPKGPPQRPRVRDPYPYAWPLPDFQGKWRRRPKVPGVLYPELEPTERPTTTPAPETRPSPQPGTQPAARPTGDPFPAPRTRPGTRPTPRPAPLPRTSPRWPDILPYLVPFLSPTPRVSRPAQPRPLTPPGQSPLPITNPLTQPYSYRANYCPPCEKTGDKRKRKKDACTNPISGKRTFTRGGQRFRTITRRLKCPV